MFLGVVVDLAVAVVIFAVADLGCCRKKGLAEDRAVCALCASILADAGLLGFAVFVGICGGVVDVSVAIVVFAVADLGGWDDLVQARTPSVVLAGAYAIFASTCAGIRAITLSSASIESCITGFLACVGASARRVFIDISIAIIVFSVSADLVGLGLDVGSTHQFALFAARELATSALSELLRNLARRCWQQHIVVDLSVAIVVSAIAGGFFGFIIAAVYEIIAFGAIGPSFFAFAGFLGA